MLGEFKDVPRGIRSRMASLAELLDQPWTYKIPPFQRPYSWQEDNVDQLVEDLRRAAAHEYSYYFLGHIVVVRDNDIEAFVVDGQQRLITLTILLAYLRDKSADKPLALALQQLIAPMAKFGRLDPHAAARVMLRQADQAMFRDFIQQPGRVLDLVENPPAHPKSQMLMARAAGIVVDALDRLTDHERETLARFLLRRVTFNLIETEDRDGASMLFRVINHRGLLLNNPAIIKTEMFERARLPEDEAAAAAERWDALEDDLGGEKFQELLNQIPVIVSGRPYQNPGDVGVFRRAVIDTVDPAWMLREGLWEYVSALQEVNAADVNAGEASEAINRSIRCMMIYKERSWLAPAVSFLAGHRDDVDLLKRFFEALERMTFASVLGVVSNNARFERFAAIIRAGADERALFGPNGALTLSAGENTVFIRRINEAIPRNENKRRVLARRANAALPGGEALLGPTREATVEHILPQTDTPYWLKQFPNSDRRNEFRHLLGNFAILTQNQNDEAANRTYDEKREIYFGKRCRELRAPVRALTADIEQYGEWNEMALMVRHELLVNRLCEDLGLS